MSNPRLFRQTLIIHGMVQGVWFRDWTVKLAEQLGLKGLVANEPDGTVKIVAEGELAKLQELERESARGPKHAKVEKVESDYHPISEFHYANFEMEDEL